MVYVFSGCEELGYIMPGVVDSCVQYSDSCVESSIWIDKSWKIDHFLIQRKSVSPDKLVHQIHLSYCHVNLGHVTVAEIDTRAPVWWST